LPAGRSPSMPTLGFFRLPAGDSTEGFRIYNGP
jgi:hypothetical protein